MFKAIWMSDPHFTCEGNVLGHDPRVRLQAAIKHINHHHADSDFCVISGDMVNRGSLDDYDALRRQLDALTIPYFPLVGNHDERSIFRTQLPLPDNCMSNFVQYSLQVENSIVLCLDTKKPGSDAGEFCDERRLWLQNVLTEAGETPVYIFMHHPPMSLGLPMQDMAKMEDGGQLLDILLAYDCVKYLFIGHVHRPITGTIRGIPFATIRSILYQAPAPQPNWTWDRFKPAEEAPNLGVLTVAKSDVNLQFVQFCPYGQGVES